MIDFNKRTTTSFGLSIGTGLMFETLLEPTMERYDPKRIIPLRVKRGDFQGYYINISTIARNIITAFPNNIDPTYILKDKGFKTTLLYELKQMESLCSTISLPCAFYYHNFDKILLAYNPTKPLKYTQPITLNTDIYNTLVKIDFKKEGPGLNYLLNIPHLPILSNNRNKILITTHIPLDLCHPNEFYLLESHTGVINTKVNFYKKYNSIGSKDMSRIPMCESLLYLIGDRNLSMIKSTQIRFKIQEESIAKKWDYKTNEIKIKEFIKKNKDLYDIYKLFKHVY